MVKGSGAMIFRKLRRWQTFHGAQAGHRVRKLSTCQEAIVCDDPPLMYVIPRAGDCVFGGTNELSSDREPDPATTAAIVAECSRVLEIEPPTVLGERVGLRPFRRAGVCLRADRLRDGRRVIHNYGHGGSGFTLSWGCAEAVFDVAKAGEASASLEPGCGVW